MQLSFSIIEYLLPASPPVLSVGKYGFRSIVVLGMAEIYKIFSWWVGRSDTSWVSDRPSTAYTRRPTSLHQPHAWSAWEKWGIRNTAPFFPHIISIGLIAFSRHICYFPSFPSPSFYPSNHFLVDSADIVHRRSDNHCTMSYDEIEIEDMSWNEELQAFTYPCPCGDLFQITMVCTRFPLTHQHPFSHFWMPFPSVFYYNYH